MSRKRTTHYQVPFTVWGCSDFPIDMLRYDRAIPASEADSHLITETGNRSRVIHLVRFVQPGMQENPTIDRWKSFGWVVQ